MHRGDAVWKNCQENSAGNNSAHFLFFRKKKGGSACPEKLEMDKYVDLARSAGNFKEELTHNLSLCAGKVQKP